MAETVTHFDETHFDDTHGTAPVPPPPRGRRKALIASAVVVVAAVAVAGALGLGGVALLVGGVGVGNTMVISVLERRSEIGLRRALGAPGARSARSS